MPSVSECLLADAPRGLWAVLLFPIDQNLYEVALIVSKSCFLGYYSTVLPFVGRNVPVSQPPRSRILPATFIRL